jgi:MraZ protein
MTMGRLQNEGQINAKKKPVCEVVSQKPTLYNASVIAGLERAVFLGKHPVKFEEQTRFLAPADFKKDLASGFFMVQGFDRNLMVFPAIAFDGVYQSISSQNIADPQVRALLRLILGTAHKLEINEQGYVSIPPALKEFASLDQTVLLIGQGDFFEIWEPASWEKQETQLTDTDTNSTRFSSLVVATRQSVPDIDR